MKTCQCIQCIKNVPHASDCGVHNNPIEPCDCRPGGGYTYVPGELRNSIGKILWGDDFAPGHDYDEGEKTIARLAFFIDAALQTLLEKERAEGRRIQAEATFEKWQNTHDDGDFTTFLDGQVEAWRYETAPHKEKQL